ncbi:MAG: hypothetical protein IPL69_19350 [Saprospiraceae bacterium]|nr:hypothetical protein [Candidatus Brachybacter algidus]
MLGEGNKALPKNITLGRRRWPIHRYDPASTRQTWSLSPAHRRSFVKGRLARPGYYVAMEAREAISPFPVQ